MRKLTLFILASVIALAIAGDGSVGPAFAKPKKPTKVDCTTADLNEKGPSLCVKQMESDILNGAPSNEQHYVVCMSDGAKFCCTKKWGCKAARIVAGDDFRAPTTGVLDPGPPVRDPKGGVRAPGGGLLDPGTGPSQQGPAATGTPVAPPPPPVQLR